MPRPHRSFSFASRAALQQAPRAVRLRHSVLSEKRMAAKSKKAKHGGVRVAGPGKKIGHPRIAGDQTQRIVSVTLSDDLREYAREIGARELRKGGVEFDVSEGVRRALKFHRAVKDLLRDQNVNADAVNALLDVSTYRTTDAT